MEDDDDEEDDADVMNDDSLDNLYKVCIVYIDEGPRMISIKAIHFSLFFRVYFVKLNKLYKVVIDSLLLAVYQRAEGKQKSRIKH